MWGSRLIKVAISMATVVLITAHMAMSNPVESNTPKPVKCGVEGLPKKLGSCVSVFGGVLGDPLLTDCCMALHSGGSSLQEAHACICDAIDGGFLGESMGSHLQSVVLVNILITCGRIPATASTTSYSCSS